MSEELIIIKPGATKFKVGDHTYMQQIDMSTQRYEYFDQLWPRFVFGMDYLMHRGEIAKACNALLYAETPQKAIHEGATILTNIHRNMLAVDGPSRVEVALEICALVFNRDGENTITIDDNLMEEKKADFRRCNASFFLTCAATFIPGLLEDLRKLPETLESLMDVLTTLQTTQSEPFLQTGTETSKPQKAGGSLSRTKQSPSTGNLSENGNAFT